MRERPHFEPFRRGFSPKDPNAPPARQRRGGISSWLLR